MKIGKLEKYFMVGLEDSVKIGASAVKNTAIAGFEIGKYAAGNAGRVIKELYSPGREIAQIVIKEIFELGKQSGRSIGKATREIRGRCREIYNDKSNVRKYGLK